MKQSSRRFLDEELYLSKCEMANTVHEPLRPGKILLAASTGGVGDPSVLSDLLEFIDSFLNTIDFDILFCSTNDEDS